MIHGLYPFLNVQLRIFVLWQFRSVLEEEVVWVRMLGLLGVVQWHGPKWCGGVNVVILLR